MPKLVVWGEENFGQRIWDNVRCYEQEPWGGEHIKNLKSIMRNPLEPKEHHWELVGNKMRT
jgi:hypothetical protein